MYQSVTTIPEDFLDAVLMEKLAPLMWLISVLNAKILLFMAPLTL